jgi:hypothetical protein
MPDNKVAWLATGDPTAVSGSMWLVFARGQATEMKSADAQQLIRQADDGDFRKYLWQSIPIAGHPDKCVVQGTKK